MQKSPPASQNLNRVCCSNIVHVLPQDQEDAVDLLKQ